jgi:hypothetical protein
LAVAATAARTLFQRQAGLVQRVERGRVGVDRQQPVVARDFDAMAGEIDQGHVGAFGIFAKIVERAPHAPQIPVGFENNLEAELLQRRFHRLAVMDGIGEWPHQPVVILCHDQCHAPFRHRCGGR